MEFQVGSTIRFTYNHPSEAIDEATGDRFKEIFVLQPLWRARVHGIDLKRLTAAEREVIRASFDPESKKKPHRLSIVNDILKRMDPIEEIKNPQSFYQKFVKVFLRNKDAYRTYDPARMMNVTQVVKSHVVGAVINPNPLFKKEDSNAGPSVGGGSLFKK